MGVPLPLSVFMYKDVLVCNVTHRDGRLMKSPNIALPGGESGNNGAGGGSC